MIQRPLTLLLLATCSSAAPVDFVRDVRPIFEAHCYDCHSGTKHKSGLRLDIKSEAMKGGDNHGPDIVPGNAKDSPLYHFLITEDEDELMPPEGRLSDSEIDIIKRWISEGAPWPDGIDTAQLEDKTDHWAFKPLAIPESKGIDSFIDEKLAEKGLHRSPPAEPIAWLRRVTFDLTGLPPSPEEVDAFLKHQDHTAVVERLLSSPRYGERWAQHWLDVVRYADTHGFEVNTERPNAWPYRDYVIRAFNEDKPYNRFVREQIAGDVLYPYTRDGVEALGFIAAGPWDFIGHAEVAESKTDGKIARNLDRDDMVASTMNTFVSTTLQCARCHDHKFDRFATQETYYGMQAVFAALDRTDKRYDLDPSTGWQRAELEASKARLLEQLATWETLGARNAGSSVSKLDAEIKALETAQAEKTNFYGYQSPAAPEPNVSRWVQIDLKQSVALRRLELFPAQGDPRKPRDARGFPVRFKIEASDDPAFKTKVTRLVDHTSEDFPTPGVEPLSWSIDQTARYVRFTATVLPKVRNDYLFALAELKIWNSDGVNAATGAIVSAPDVEDFLAPRWTLENLVDGVTPEAMPARQAQIVAANAARTQAIEEAMEPEQKRLRDKARQKLAGIEKELATLPEQAVVYAGGIHRGEGTFVGTGANGGKPREIFVLHRGDVNSPKKRAHAGAVALTSGASAEFAVPEDAPEGERRAALARWLTDPANPLTWRSIVNRIWQYHFGRAIVDTPNDFGRMGQTPSHPELLDWLAVEFRDGGQSFKALSRLIVTSAAYRQISSLTPATEAAMAVDADNRFLWRMNPRRLEAEAVRDSMLLVTGKLDLTMGGPSFQDFVVEQPAHSPHYRYGSYDPNDPRSHRRTVYRMIVRSQPQPFLGALDCADPSLSVEKRNESMGALQALAMMNNRFVIAMSEQFAARLQKEASTPTDRITRAFQLTLGRDPTSTELTQLSNYATTYGWANACRLILNLNEFAFVD